MKIQQKPGVNINPRFGSGELVKPSTLENSLFKPAEKFLTMAQRSEKYFDTFIKNHPNNPIAKLIGSIGKNALPKILAQDYHEVASLPKLGRVVVEPPIGALVVLLFGFALSGRLFNAVARAADGDRRELRDILFRDIPTFTLILFALNPMVRLMSQRLEKLKGIQLVQNGKVFGYSELDNIYRVDSANRLKSILAKPQNTKGVLNAIDNSMKNPHLSPALKSMLGKYKDAVQDAIKIATNKGAHSPEFEKAAHKAYKMLNVMEISREGYLKQIGNGQATATSKLIQKFTTDFNNKVPTFNKMFSSYAKSSRVWANAVAFGIVIGLLGFGVTWFNKWFTEKEYEKLTKQQNSKPEGAGNAEFDINAFLNAMQAGTAPAFQGNYHKPGSVNFQAFQPR
jgi:hypothetical protein